MASRGTFPGGLRAQLLIGLCVLLIGAFASAALVVQNVLTQRLLRAREQHAHQILELATDLPAAQRAAIVETGAAAAITVDGESFGPPDLIARLSDAPQFVRIEEERFLVVKRRHGQSMSAIAVPLDDVQAEVASARSVLFLFVIVVTVLFIALGYGFFGFLVVRPVRAISVATERAADGDLASPISLRPRNEFGRVADSFNEMLVRLDRNRTELEERLEQLTQANEELGRTRDTLVRSEKLASVGQLAAGIAHEIGNPLAALSGYNELLLDGDLEPDEAADLLTRSGEQLERIRSVIRSLLDFSRDDAQRAPEPTNIERCVAEAVGLVAAMPDARGVSFDVEGTGGPHVLAVPSQVVQVFVNLLINAADAVGGDGTVRIRRVDHPQAGTVEVSFEDDGPGVPEELLGRLFDPFFTTKDPGEGTGLGLAISARIVQSFGGDLEAAASDLGGARFVVTLPLVVTEAR